MANVFRFPGGGQPRTDFERVRAAYTVRDISRQFGLSEYHIRRWTRDGWIPTAPDAKPGEIRYDFQGLARFRRVRELRNQGLSIKQIEAELGGQLNLFPEHQGMLLQLPARLSPIEEALRLHERGDPRAAESYRRAIEQEDSATDAYCNLGILECEKGNVVEAFDCFTKALLNDPRHFESHLNLAHLYFECGDLRLARLHYELAARIEPNFPDLYFNLGLVHAVKGEFEEAVNVLKRAKEMGEEDEGRRIDELLGGIAGLLRAAAPRPEQ